MNTHAVHTKCGRLGLARCCVLFAMVLASLLCGCETTRSTSTSIVSESDGLVEFERGAGRPPTALTLYRMGHLLASQGKDRQAAAVLQAAIDRYPSFSPAYRELSEIQIRSRWLDKAIDTLQTGVAEIPNDPVLHNNLGMAYILIIQYESAMQHFARAHELHPRNARYLSNMAMAAAMLSDYDQALGLYRQILPPAIAHYNVAVLCEANGAEERAAEEYARALEIDPDYRAKLQSEDLRRQ